MKFAEPSFRRVYLDDSLLGKHPVPTCDASLEARFDQLVRKSEAQWQLLEIAREMLFYVVHEECLGVLGMNYAIEYVAKATFVSDEEDSEFLSTSAVLRVVWYD